MVALSLVDFGTAAFLELSYVPLLGALGLSALLILFGGGPGRSGAKVNLGPVQPIEAIRLLLAFFLAGYFARRWELLRDLRGSIDSQRSLAGLAERAARRIRAAGSGRCRRGARLFFRPKGSRARAAPVLRVPGDVRRGARPARDGGRRVRVVDRRLLFRISRFDVSRTLAERVRMWQSPWDNAGAGRRSGCAGDLGDGNGGPLGTGLGLGDSRYLPAGHTDLVLAAVGEELGVVGADRARRTYAVVAWRGFRIARSAPNDYGFFLGTALTLFLIVPVAGDGGRRDGHHAAHRRRHAVSELRRFGDGRELCGARHALVDPRRSRARRPISRHFARPAPMAVSGLLAVVRAGARRGARSISRSCTPSDYVVKPHLGVQADGGRRYAYNPRVLDS